MTDRFWERTRQGKGTYEQVHEIVYFSAKVTSIKYWQPVLLSTATQNSFLLAQCLLATAGVHLEQQPHMQNGLNVVEPHLKSEAANVEEQTCKLQVRLRQTCVLQMYKSQVWYLDM
ncbi:unnamed protein product [Durusdinium trenchii]|uniref:Uncharacterized protein n=1 Tax=Durusdinium trenchii TaxID=1381693 RepID=A0ABP0PVS3_9DINO